VRLSSGRRQSAFVAIGDLARPATYQSLTGNITRDLVAGTSVAEVVTYNLKRTVFTKFKEKEIDTSVVVETDEKIMFPALDLPVEPKSADTLLDEHGRTWEIIKRLSAIRRPPRDLAGADFALMAKFKYGRKAASRSPSTISSRRPPTFSSVAKTRS
jgi:hypothetical protein